MPVSLAMFPGQGSQRVGMGRKLLQEFPKAAHTFEEAEDSVRLSIRKLCLEGPEDELQKTANQQPCILTLSVAVWRVLCEETGFSPQYFAGHSLGEYSALVAAGGLTLERAVRLVRSRGQFMQEACPNGTGAMAAVIGFDPEQLRALCSDLQKKTGRCVELVNYNSPVQQIISGHRDAVQELSALLGDQNIRTVMLPVSAPFHSSLMSPAREAMEPLLETLDFSGAGQRVIPNLTGNIEAAYVPRFLIDQTDHPVLWTRTLETARESGCRIFAEIGPGKVLSGLARKTLTDNPADLKIISTENLKQATGEIIQLTQ